MNILILITHGNIGGATNFVYFLAKGLKEKNIEVKVGFGEGDYLKEKLEKEKIPFINFKWLKRTYNPLSNFFFVFELKKFLDKEKFDIVHFNSTNTLFGAISAKLSKTKPKTIFTFHGLSILDPNYKKYSFLKPIFFLIFKILLKFIDQSVFVCQENLNWAQKNKLVSNGTFIYNGIPEIDFLDRKEARKFFSRKINLNLEDKFLIGSIGRLDYAKNYEFLIKIFPKILKWDQKSILIIIGDGPERKKLENLIRKFSLENKVFLLGEIQNASQYLKAFDLFILPSRYEGLSITLIEALFAEIPILASNVGGNKEIIGKENVFTLNSEEEILNKIKNLPKIDSERKNKFTLSQMIKSYLALYQGLKQI